LWIQRGTPNDYAELERFHYRPGRPATWADVWLVKYQDRQGQNADDTATGRIVALAVLSWPVPNVKGRWLFFAMRDWSYKKRLRFANRNIRTISRVIVHPQFRGVGLASLLVRHVFKHCPTRYVEALAVMGKAHPFFQKAGMLPVDQGPDAHVLYYVYDRSIH
jgi:GNAT superfamily N-acetyltransferase